MKACFQTPAIESQRNYSNSLIIYQINENHSQSEIRTDIWFSLLLKNLVKKKKKSK